jgi:hypothetical protein
LILPSIRCRIETIAEPAGYVAMPTELDTRLKTALDESRLLILGAQVLFGFTFQGIFQELFAQLSLTAKAMQCVALLCLTMSVVFLIVPSMYHRIACQGRSVHRAVHVATKSAGASLLPLTLGLGACAFVVFERLVGLGAATLIAVGLSASGFALLYGLGIALRKPAGPLPPQEETDLKTKIEQLLTEARVIIPGGQALLGFQFVATLTKAFDELPPLAQVIHACGLGFVTLSVLLLMTPAALHRLAYHGEDSAEFFRIGSWLVTAAALPLALGISSDIFVVLYKVSSSLSLALAGAGASTGLFLGAWYAYPLASQRHG